MNTTIHTQIIPENRGLVKVLLALTATNHVQSIDDWTTHKRQAALVAQHMINSPQLEMRGTRMKNCGDKLIYTYDIETNRYKFASAWLCRDRLCPICAWRLSIKRISEMQKVLQLLSTRYPKTKAIHVVLTVKSVPIEQLRDTIKALTTGFTRLKKRKVYKQYVLGYARSVEVTYNDKTGLYHPHIHCICIVDDTYSKQIHMSEWSDMWQESVRINYRPIVWAQGAYTKRQVKPDIEQFLLEDYRHESAQAAILEAIKYACKPDAITASAIAGDIPALAAAINGCRLISYGGIIKTLRAEINAGDDEPEQLPECTIDPDDFNENYTVMYMWSAAQRRYIRAETGGCSAD